MLHLPRGKSVRKGVNPARINLPEAMGKLRTGNFSGYLRFDAETGTGIILFENGQLVSAMFVNNDDTERQIAYDAVAKIFEISILGQATLDIYSLSAGLIRPLHALLHGRYLNRGLLLEQIDVRSQLQQVAAEKLTACLRVYAGDQTTLIFYDKGVALGFFHDGQTEITREADVLSSVARLPGAKLDVLEVRSGSELVLTDLMGNANLLPIWQQIRESLAEERRKAEERDARTREELIQQRQETFTRFKIIADKHVGKLGVTKVEKAFDQVGENFCSKELEKFFAVMEDFAESLPGQIKITAMIEEMKQEVS
ncbi:MAG: hypothetical protein C0622_00545 [Desulfuromonas sp.]|nr:MAG: hypothetical protein C0622_00545 [Desulfuromonas sp.]